MTSVKEVISSVHRRAVDVEDIFVIAFFVDDHRMSEKEMTGRRFTTFVGNFGKKNINAPLERTLIV